MTRRARKGIAGIISALILFSLVFTIGAGFYLNASDDQQMAANAYSGRLSSQAQASHESLTLKVGNGTYSGEGYLWLMINNTGGVDSTIMSVYVTSLSGKMLSYSDSTDSPFLSQTTDLNVSLPITLDPGVSTSDVGGNIRILPTAFFCTPVKGSMACGGQTLFVNVLTKLGNVFSVAFPVINSITVKNVLVNQNLLDEYLASQSVSLLEETEYIGGCTGCVSGYYAGGNILVVLLTATPSPVEQGGKITVSATVHDYSLYAADSVTVTLNATYTGSATVSPDISQAGKPNYECGYVASIPSGENATVTCSFTASIGNLGGGIVTFVGEATGCVLTGTSTTSPCSTMEVGTPAASSVTSSNPVQVGEAVSFGLWRPDFYFFYYTGCSGSNCEDSPCALITDGCGAGVIPDSDTYVAVYIQVTNTGSEPLTLLDGSYIQAVSPNVDYDLFVGCSGLSAAICNLNGYSTGVSYGVTTGTINAYGCAQVGSGLCGGTGGSNSAILLDFAACTSAPSVCSGGDGNYVATTQQIAFEGIVVP